MQALLVAKWPVALEQHENSCIRRLYDDSVIQAAAMDGSEMSFSMRRTPTVLRSAQSKPEVMWFQDAEEGSGQSLGGFPVACS